MPFQNNNNNYQNRPQNNFYNNGGNNQQQQQRPPRQNVGQGGYQGNNRYPGQNRPQGQNIQVQPVVPVQALPQQVVTTGMEGGPQTPLLSADPMVAAYNQKGFTYLPAVVPHNPNYKTLVGEFIYEYVEKFVGDQRAPKITGMLIDLPIEEIKAYLYDFGKLYTKISEAVALLAQIQAPVAGAHQVSVQ